MAEEIRILYEDPYLVVCVKPVGVLSEDSENGRSLHGCWRSTTGRRESRLYRHGASAGQDRGRSDGAVPATGGHGQADGGHSRS